MHCEPLLYCPTGRAGLGLQLFQQAGFEAVRFICCRADIVFAVDSIAGGCRAAQHNDGARRLPVMMFYVPWLLPRRAVRRLDRFQGR